MNHLYSSVVAVYRQEMTMVDGEGEMDWILQPEPLSYVKCRIDLNHLRPGRDQLPVPINNKAPDRTGVLFCSADVPLRAGDHLTAISNSRGQIVVPGTFEIKAMPDMAIDYGSAHHIEVQVFEIAQDLLGVYTGRE